jgi:hypothetical protein
VDSSERDIEAGNTSVPRDLACGMLVPERLPISYLRDSGSGDPPRGLIDFLGALSGSYWYAVFLSPLRSTSRDKTYCTATKMGCQRHFARMPSFLMYGAKGAPKGGVVPTDGRCR